MLSELYIFYVDVVPAEWPNKRQWTTYGHFSVQKCVYGNVYKYVEKCHLMSCEGKCFYTYLTSSLITPTYCFLISWMWRTPFYPLWLFLAWMDFCTARVRVLYSHLHLICSFLLISKHYPHPTISFSFYQNQYTRKTNSEKQQVEMQKLKKVFLSFFFFLVRSSS